MSETLEVEKIIRLVSERTQLRQKLRQALGIDDDYPRKSDLKPILDELVLLRKDMDRRFEELQKTFGEQLKVMKDGFSFQTERLDRLTTNVKRMGGEDLELLSLSFYKAILEGKRI